MTILKFIAIIMYFIASTTIAHAVVPNGKRPAQRVISLSPHITELLFAAGGADHIVGVIKHSDYPEAAKHLPIIGDSRELNIERIITLKPDWVVVWREGSSARQIAQLQKLGLSLFFIDIHKLDDIPGSLQRLGQLMGTERVANTLVDELNWELSMLTNKYAHLPPVRLFYQVWDTPLFTLNGQHIVSDAIRVCGGKNIFSGQKSIAPMVSLEAVMKANPEAIVGTGEGKHTIDALFLWKRYTEMTAVKNGNLIVLSGDLINRPGPRMFPGVKALCEQLEEVRQRRR